MPKSDHEDGAASFPFQYEPVDPAIQPLAPEWQVSTRTMYIRTMVEREPVPLFADQIDLWVDNQDPFSFSSLSVKVYVSDGFWAVCLRCFVRVNGVRARVINTIKVLM